MAIAIKIKKTTFKHVEAEWYNYYETLKEIANLREEIMYPMQEQEDINIVKGANSVRQPGDPTEKIATRLTTNKRIKHLQEIATAIETVYNVLPKDYKKLVCVKYWSRHNLTWDGIALELSISKRQAIRWRNIIIQAIVEVLGWH